MNHSPDKIASTRARTRGKALVLGWDPRSCLAVMRSLGRRAVEVHLAWSTPDSICRASRYLVCEHPLPPYHQGVDWLAPLVELMRREQFDLIVPCHDETMLPLQLHRRELEPYGRICLLEDRVFEIVSDKFKTEELAASLGVPTPGGLLLERFDQAAALPPVRDWPVVLKPIRSCSVDNLTRRNAVRKVNTREELETALRSMLGYGPVLVQANFSGTGMGVEILADHGEILFAFQHVRLHEPPGGGGGSYRKSVALHPELLAATEKLARALGLSGVAMFEYKMNLQTGQWLLLEINGRFWGSLPLALAAGADFPYFLYEWLVHGRRDFPRDYVNGIYCRQLSQDCRWLWRNLKADRSDPALATVPLGRVAGEIIHVLTLHEHTDEFVFDDPGPAWRAFAQAWAKAWRKAVYQLRGRTFALPWMRARAGRRAQAAAHGARKILFVCMGNICRSPFAQACAQSLLPAGIQIDSAGYFPEKGRPCPEAACRVAAEFGVDLTAHRSVLLSEEMVREADLILIFDVHNWKTMAACFPRARSKVHLLGLLAPDGPAVIDDPFGGLDEDYCRCYRQIRDAIFSCFFRSDGT